METERNNELNSRIRDAKTTTSNKKSKLIQGSSHQPVPRWEKKFCTSICSIPWKKLCETEKLLYMYPKIVEWNDSEGEEAFCNAKARYWEEINHLPCTVPLPDPNMYIDIIDDNAAIDPELVADLYKQPALFQDDDGDKDIFWDSFQFTTDTVPVTGWGDEEDQVHTIYATDQSIQIQPTGRGGEEDQVRNTCNNERSLQIQHNGWGDGEDQVPSVCINDQSIQIQPTGWGDEQDQVLNSYLTDQSVQIQPTVRGDTENPTNEIDHDDTPPSSNSKTRNNCGDYHCGRDRDYSWQHHAYRNEEYNWKEQGGSHLISHCTTRRYWGRKKTFNAYEQTLCYKPQQDATHSCDPMNYRGSSDSHGGRGRNHYPSLWV